MLTDTRYFWNYQTNNPRYQKQVENANKEAEHWYNNRQIDLRIADVIRYYTIAGTGVLHHYFSRQINDMMVEAEDPRNVYPIDPISYHTFRQTARGVICRRPRTPDWVKEEYGKTVRPDTGGTGGFFGWIIRSVLEGPGERGGPLTKRSKADKPNSGISNGVRQHDVPEGSADEQNGEGSSYGAVGGSQRSRCYRRARDTWRKDEKVAGENPLVVRSAERRTALSVQPNDRLGRRCVALRRPVPVLAREIPAHQVHPEPVAQFLVRESSAVGLPSAPGIDQCESARDRRPRGEGCAAGDYRRPQCVGRAKNAEGGLARAWG